MMRCAMAFSGASQPRARLDRTKNFGGPWEPAGRGKGNGAVARGKQRKNQK